MNSIQARQWIEEVYNEYGKFVAIKAGAICKDEEFGRDCLQEATLIMLMGMPLPTKEATRATLWTIAINKAIDHTRRKQAEKRYQLVTQYIYTEEASPKEGLFAYHPLGASVLALVRTLREAEQIAAVAYMYSIPIRRLAGIMGIDGNAVQYHLKAAFKKIRLLLYTGKEHVVRSDGEANTARRRDPRTDEVYQLRIQGHSFKEIADSLGIQAKYAVNRYHNRIRSMRKYPDVFKDLTTVKTA